MLDRGATGERQVPLLFRAGPGRFRSEALAEHSEADYLAL
jgi:hypothetical protein